ncbi:hypothetical protein [uncultured Flavobacterium sp.]|uniref:hypothetical protein n=1 Tax=uncultured Flavobacterium sp. TaxID=165435 RepID=UPI0025EE6798|nr:hypothetical protein [uncultured Flavobacterium sp.]
MKAITALKAILLIVTLSLVSCKEEKTKETVKEAFADPVRVVTDHPEKEAESATDTVNASDPIAIIKSEFTRINSSSLTKKSHTYQCDELMKIDYYYEGENVVKAVVDYGTVGDHYQKSEFYYKDGKLFFFYDFVEGGPACEGCEMKLEQRYYIKDDLVIKYIKNQTPEKCEICNFSQRSTPYRALKAAKTLDFKTAFCR